MSKYRFVSNGSAYRVQWRPRFWPFWFWLTQPNEGGGDSILEFESMQEAEDYIAERTDIKDWKAVESPGEFGAKLRDL